MTTDTPSPSALAKGDIVRLKSGGPKMTLLQPEATGQVKCQWFDRNGKMHVAGFDIEMVEKFKAKPPAW